MPRMMILDKNVEQGQNNSKWSWRDISNKLDEEATELMVALHEQDKAHISEEALDVIQIAIGILDKLEREGVDINQEFLRHEKKLINRHWKPKGEIEIKVYKYGRV